MPELEFIDDDDTTARLTRLNDARRRLADRLERESVEFTPGRKIDNPLFRIRRSNGPHCLHHKDFPTWTLNQRRRTIRYLYEDGQDWSARDIGERILDCKKSAPCHSMFCPFCRDEIQLTMAMTAKRVFADTPGQQMAFLTILLPVTYRPGTEAKELIDRCRRQINNLLTYRNISDVKLFGAFEIDVKRPRYVRGRKHSKKALEALDTVRRS